jgi:hypothetical protein
LSGGGRRGGGDGAGVINKKTLLVYIKKNEFGGKKLTCSPRDERHPSLEPFFPSCCILVLSFLSARKGVTVGVVLVVQWWPFIESSLSVVYYYNSLMIIRKKNDVPEAASRAL